MEGISSITSRMAGLQSQVDALSAGAARRASGTATTPTGTTSASTAGAGSGAFADVLAQQLGSSTTSSTTSSTAAPGDTSTLGTLLGTATTTPQPALTTTTTTSLSSDGLAQLLASLPGARATTSPVTTGGGAVPGVTGADAATAAPVVAVGQLDAKGVPLDLKAYGNGKVPTDQLVPIGGAGSGERLWAPAAAAFDRMSAAARADGVSFSVNDSYRSYEDQVAMAARKGLRSQGGLAAAPGTSSHGWGMAVDLQLDGRAQAWMRENAGTYGFAETVSGEPWHWGFRPQAV